MQLLIPNFYRWAREHNKNLIIAAATLFIVIGGLVAAFNTRVDIRLDSYGNVIDEVTKGTQYYKTKWTLKNFIGK